MLVNPVMWLRGVSRDDESIRVVFQVTGCNTAGTD